MYVVDEPPHIPCKWMIDFSGPPLVFGVLNELGVEVYFIISRIFGFICLYNVYYGQLNCIYPIWFYLEYVIYILYIV